MEEDETRTIESQEEDQEWIYRREVLRLKL